MIKLYIYVLVAQPGEVHASVHLCVSQQSSLVTYLTRSTCICTAFPFR